MSMKNEKNEKRKRYGVIWIMCLLTWMLLGFGMTVNAAQEQLGQYFSVKVAMEISLSKVKGEQQSIADTRMVPAVLADGGIDSTIEDWGQAVFAGSKVSAHLERKSGVSSDIAAPAVTYKWVLTKGSATQTMYGTYITVPRDYAGGSMTVTATVQQNSQWAKSSVTSLVTIS